MDLDQFLKVIQKSNSHELVTEFCYKKIYMPFQMKANTRIIWKQLKETTLLQST